MDRTQGHSPSAPLGFSADEARAIGRRLAEARLRRHLDIQDLAKKAKIREHFALAIENGEWDSLPPGLNGRGLIRIYARELAVSVPELDPTAHLSADNARFEKSEQATADEALRGQTIRSFPASERQSTLNSVAPSARTIGQAQQRAQRPPAPVKQMRTEDDESPLDVVTPDIAAVLGFNIDDEIKHENLPRQVQADTERESIPSLNVNDILGMVETDAGLELAHKQPHSESIELQQPETREPAQEEMPAKLDSPNVQEQRVGSRSTHLESLDTEFDGEENTLPIVLSKPDSSNKLEGAPEGRLSFEPSDVTQVAGNRAPRGELLAELAASAASKSSSNNEMAATLQHSRRFRPAATFVLLSGLVLIGIGAAYFLPTLSKRETVSSSLKIREIKSGIGEGTELRQAGENSKSAQSDRASSPNSREDIQQREVGYESSAVSNVESQVESPESLPNAGKVNPEVEQVVADPGASDVASTTLETTTQTEPLSPPVMETEAEPSSPHDEVAQVEGQEAVVPSDSQELSQAAEPGAKDVKRSVGIGTQVAKLELKSSVEMSLKSDGKLVLSGLQPIGTIALNFSDRAEILVRDGSLVHLTYQSWVHGPLGHEGRSRRLILKNGSFDTTGAIASGR